MTRVRLKPWPFVLVAPFALLLALPAWGLEPSGSGARLADGAGPWLRGTYWYVTEPDLPAVATDLATGQHQFVADQTVWKIEEYSKGYFWGKAVVQLTGRPVQCLDMVGSVTPDQAVQITFTLPLPGAPVEVSLRTNGIGALQRVGPEWRFKMQMTSGLGTLITHWAFMKQCRSGAPCNESLPGVRVPLQQLLAACPD